MVSGLELCFRKISKVLQHNNRLGCSEWRCNHDTCITVIVDNKVPISVVTINSQRSVAVFTSDGSQTTLNSIHISDFCETLPASHELMLTFRTHSQQIHNPPYIGFYLLVCIIVFVDKLLIREKSIIPDSFVIPF